MWEVYYENNKHRSAIGRNNFMKIAVLLILAAVAGCAITPDRARTLSEYDLCSAYLHCFQGNENRLTLEQGIKARGTKCEAPSYYGVSCDDVSKGLSRTAQQFKQGDSTSSQTSSQLLNQCVTTTDEDGNFIKTCR
ncbi:hypothetical protein A3K80_04990 [Candidatus Bathyarchaeota archaeon RBG_13_38_9]|nr:MAG: hypothetical protein A3K80_04990 [Candidatus Bathyarchaeota archaeon RBG_13_38_9]